jgi:hypothetical protein
LCKFFRKNNKNRPENIKISENGQIEGIVKENIFYGNFNEITIFANGQNLIVNSSDENLKVGDIVKLSFEDRIMKF